MTISITITISITFYCITITSIRLGVGVESWFATRSSVQPIPVDCDGSLVWYGSVLS